MRPYFLLVAKDVIPYLAFFHPEISTSEIRVPLFPSLFQCMELELIMLFHALPDWAVLPSHFRVFDSRSDNQTTHMLLPVVS